MSKLASILSRLDADLEGSLARLSSWLEIPSISTDSAYAGDSRRAAEWLARDLESLGFEAALAETPGHPIVLAHRPKPGAPHLLFYGHYDVQPVDPLELWDTEPFKPVVKEIAPGRRVIVARGACDDKGQVMTFIEAIRATLAETGDLPVGLTVMVEGEEESGSVNLPAFVRENAAALKADVALVCDTGMWDRETPAITASLRGMVYQEVTITCADRDLHSGLFGGAAANPIHVLANIVAQLHDETGRITIPGFYDGVEEPTNQQKADWADLNLTEAEFLGQIGLKHSIGEKGRMLIEQIQSRPTCDVNGIWGGYTGEGTKTVIASKASAKISFRLVGKQDPAGHRPGLPGLRPRAPARRCDRELHRAWRLAGHRSARGFGGLGRSPRGADRGMGPQGRHHRLGRIDPRRRRFQAPARHRHAARRLWPR